MIKGRCFCSNGQLQPPVKYGSADREIFIGLGKAWRVQGRGRGRGRGKVAAAGRDKEEEGQLLCKRKEG